MKHRSPFDPEAKGTAWVVSSFLRNRKDAVSKQVLQTNNNNLLFFKVNSSSVATISTLKKLRFYELSADVMPLLI